MENQVFKLAGAGFLSLIESIINNAYMEQTYSRDRDFAREMYKRQKEFSLEMFEQQKRLQSPAYIKEQLEKAGLNPLFFMGNVSASTPDFNFVSGEEFVPSPVFSSPIGQFLDFLKSYMLQEDRLELEEKIKEKQLEIQRELLNNTLRMSDIDIALKQVQKEAQELELKFGKKYQVIPISGQEDWMSLLIKLMLNGIIKSSQVPFLDKLNINLLKEVEK